MWVDEENGYQRRARPCRRVPATRPGWQESFPCAGCFFVDFYTPTWNSAVYFMRRVIRLGSFFAFRIKLIGRRCRYGFELSAGIILQALTVVTIAVQTLPDNLTDTDASFMQLGFRSPGSATQDSSNFAVFVTMQIMKYQSCAESARQSSHSRLT